MEFQLSYFKSWKMMLWKCCTEYVSKFVKLSSGHSTGKGQFSFQPQRKAMPKKAQTTAQFISHASKVMLKILQARLQQYVNRELPDVQAGFRKGKNQISNYQHLPDHRKSMRVPEKHLFLRYWRYQSLQLCGSQKSMDNSERDGNTRPPDLPLEKPVCRPGSNN